MAFEDRIIDALCMQLIQAPERFEVLVMPNLYGDVAAELGAGLIGGTGVAPGGHFGGAGGLELAVFEATHGTAPDLAGTNTADPIGAMLSGAMLLRHVGETDAGDGLEAAVAAVLADGAQPAAGSAGARGRPAARGHVPVRRRGDRGAVARLQSGACGPMLSADTSLGGSHGDRHLLESVARSTTPTRPAA